MGYSLGSGGTKFGPIEDDKDSLGDAIDPSGDCGSTEGCDDGSSVGSMVGEEDGCATVGDEDGSNDGSWVGGGVKEDFGTQPHLGFVKACNELQCCASTKPSLLRVSSKPHENVPCVGILTSTSQ